MRADCQGFLFIYRVVRLGYDGHVRTSAPQQQQQAHTEPLGVREGVRAGAAEHRHPDVVVGQVVEQLEAQHL